MKLMIEALTGTLFYIQVEDNATVGDLKKEIETQEKLPKDRLILLHHFHDNHEHGNPHNNDHQNGLLMMMMMIMVEDTFSLVDYGVRDGSHIHLCFNTLDDDDDDDDDASSQYHLLFSVPDSFIW
ncbi:uncharacterized protein LOC122640332 [Telopea speciosissima]|uniref:uncharacterized protein LOC122640332 n=1 Tax=Telopea speciosissima TaxID=54955 RepID=UPI001CC40D15|nr:uncharacterized protein LOC122640332 [Telopea speciosissima]